MSGSVVHFDLPADDIERASAFYREAFGWQLTAVPEMDYTMVSTAPTGEDGRPTEAGSINGGMSARRDPITSPVITVDVDSIEAALAKVERLGGKTVQGRQAVADMGFTGYFADSEGNVIGLWQSA